MTPIAARAIAVRNNGISILESLGPVSGRAAAQVCRAAPRPTAGMRGSDASDEKHLLERIRAGDPEAFVQVFQRYHDALLRFARAGLHGAAEAEDVVQDVFLRLWRDRSQLTVDRSLRAYLLAAVRNRIIDGVRRQAVVERSAELQVVAGGRG